MKQLKTILISVFLFLCTLPCQAQEEKAPVFIGGKEQAQEPVQVARLLSGVLGGNSVPACTTPTTGDTMNSGWLDGTYNDPALYGNGWTEDTGNPDQNFTLLGTPPTDCCTKGWRSVGTATRVSAYWDNGAAIDSATVDIDIVVACYIAAIALDDNQTVQITAWATNTTGTWGQTAYLVIGRSGAQYQLKAVGSADSAWINIAVTTWYRFWLHLDTTDTSSYIDVDSWNGAAWADLDHQTFQSAIANDGRYFHMGGMAGLGAEESLDLQVGYVYINTP